MNINKLTNPGLIKGLYSEYYLKDATPEKLVSSHWKRFSGNIRVSVDELGNLTSFYGYGFGDLQPTHFLNRALKYLCNISYFIRLPYKKDILFLAGKSRPIIKKMGSYLSYDCFRQLCSLCVIRKHLKISSKKELRVLAIGDGYGFLSAVLKSVYPEARITLVDIGKVLFFQAVNLQRIWPGYSHCLVGDKIQQGTDFLYVPAECVDKIKGVKYDLIVNIASMGEMNYDTIGRYFKFMRMNVSDDNLFYCCNRESKSLPGGETIEFLKYPWLDGDRHLVDEYCDFYRYHFSVIAPFFHRFDGLFLHRLTNLKPLGDA